ncbi:MAG TPA: hypothetical protein VGG89_12580 [Candidatus Baltobacteraceae bacterium]|jgi:hypothetical protein
MKWILGLAFALSISVGLASAEITSQTVNLTVISRCGISLVLEKAELTDEDGRLATEIRLRRIGPFFYVGRASIGIPGRYGVAALVRGATPRSDCSGGTKITILAGHDRNVDIQVTRLGLVQDAHAFLYGTLPFKGFVRGVLIGNGLEYPIEIDGDAYYAEHELPGSYLLKLSYGDSLECRIPVVIPAQGTGKRLDISIQRAQQCLGFPYHDPSTGDSGFIPLLPSPGPT